MALDAICLQAVVVEIAPQVQGLKIEKIQQPTRDQVILLLRGSRRLLLCASPSQPRLNLTALLRDNPSQPPMFCMLLRKHLSGGRILSMEQAPLERVVTLRIEAVNEMGEMGTFSLILEAVGRHANLILCDGEGRIIDCLRRVDFEMSQQRQVLPGLFYHLPPRQEKRSPLDMEEPVFRTLMQEAGPDAQADKFLLDTFTALSPLWARELSYRAGGSTDCRLSQAPRLWEEFAAWQDLVQQGNFLPTVIDRDGKPADFTFAPVLQYENAGEIRTCDSFSVLLDDFFREREQADRVRQKGQDLLKTAANARDRLRRKLSMQAQEYEKTQDRDRLRISGELITANLYRMERGMRTLEAENYYEEGCPKVTIPLDVRLSPQENAAKYFKQYNKAKTAEKMLSRLMAQGREELGYLESVVQEIGQAESEQDFADIRLELTDGGYIRGRGKKQPGFQRKSEPRRFRTDSGLLVLVGRSNRQNDKLTAKTADRGDLWLHTQKIHGSHVILCTQGAEPDEGSILQAAKLAAYYSQGRGGGKVAVDYTPVKYVKKPAGSRPGMVVYTTYRTLLVEPDEELVRRLAIK